jgi:hypothetical protein
MNDISGSANDEQKSYAAKLFKDFVGAEGMFCFEQARRIVVKKVDFDEQHGSELGLKMKARMICEIKIEKDMLHAADAVSLPLIFYFHNRRALRAFRGL